MTHAGLRLQRAGRRGDGRLARGRGRDGGRLRRRPGPGSSPAGGTRRTVEGAVFVTADVRKPAGRRAGGGDGGRALRPARRAGEQRRRLTPGHGGRRVAALRRGGRGPEPAGPAVVRAVGPQGHGGPGGRRVHRQRRERVGAAAVAGRLGLRRGQGGSHQPDHDAGRGVGAAGAGQLRERPGCSTPGPATSTTAGPAAWSAVAATVPLGRMGTPEDVARPACSWPAPARRTSRGPTSSLHGGGEWPAYLRAQDEA